MKTKFLFIITVLAAFTSCVKDKTYKTYTIYRPEYKVKQAVKDAAKLQTPQALKNLGNFALYNNLMLVNEKDKGIHVIDYSNATSPVNKGFIPIPGNTGVAVKNNMLYADCYCELFVFKIQNSTNIQFQTAVPNVFLKRMGYSNYDAASVELNWIKKDTTVADAKLNQSCFNCLYNGYYTTADVNFSNASSSSSPSGGNSIGSSLAVFAVVNDYLYTIDDLNLYSFSLSDPANPVLTNGQKVNWGIETIFPFKDKLFLGSTTGMFVYGLQNPAAPNYISVFNHARVCDPVIAEDKYAFVTLRSGSRCNGFTNQLDVINIEDVTKPFLVTSFPFTNPHGLSKDGNIMFICDGTNGLKVIDATNPGAIVTKQTISGGEMLDVIAYNNLAVVMQTNAINFYSYDQQFNVNLLSTIAKN